MIATKLVMEERETLLSSVRPRPATKGLFEGSSRLEFSDAWAEIDLGTYRGQRIALKWVVYGISSDVDVSLGQVRLYPKHARTPRPDVLIVCSDTHRYEYALGKEGKALMPRLQALAQESIVFPSAYSSASWTLPSMTSALTGLPPRSHHTGRMARSKEPHPDSDGMSVPQEGHFVFSPGKSVTAYPKELVTLPERLRLAGYTTALVAANWLYWMSGLGFDGNDFFINTDVVPGQQVNSAALWVLEQVPRREPLYMLVHYMDVHEWPRWYFGRQFPELGLSRGSRSQVIESYSQAVQDTDRVLESLLEAWAKRRNIENSLIIFLSDHGEHLKDPGFDHDNSMNAVLCRFRWKWRTAFRR